MRQFISHEATRRLPSAWMLVVAGLVPPAASGACFGGCEVPLTGTCGDGILSRYEACDGPHFGDETCETLGYGGGTLHCTVNCEIDESGCEPAPACGNGALDFGEECDGTESFFGSEAECSDWDLSGEASLACDEECHHDVRGCSSERCDNRWDDDGDGLVDCDDPDCLGIAPCGSELCYDAVDNDDDGMTDCEDPDCASNFPACNAGLYPTEDAHLGLCGNNRDDDDDGLEDREDPDCLGYRSVLYVRDPNGGAFLRGEYVDVELLLYADATDLESILVSLPLPEGLSVSDFPLGGTYYPETHEVEWTVALLTWGTAISLRFLGRIALGLDFGDDLCLQATIASTAPADSWVSDDPESIGETLPTCVTVR